MDLKQKKQKTKKAVSKHSHKPGGGEDKIDTFISAAAVSHRQNCRSVCEREWMRKRRHLLQQAPSKHLCLLQRQRETCGGPGVARRGRYLVKERYEFCVGGERDRRRNVISPRR